MDIYETLTTREREVLHLAEEGLAYAFRRGLVPSGAAGAAARPSGGDERL